MEQALLHDARGAGAHLRDTRGFEPAGQFGEQAHVAGGDGDDAHFRGRHPAAWRAALGVAALPAGSQQRRQAQAGETGQQREVTGR